MPPPPADTGPIALADGGLQPDALQPSDTGIMWGVNAHPVQGGPSKSIPYARQMSLLKEAGLRSYRMDVYNTGSDMIDLASVLAAAKPAGVVVLPALDIGPDLGTDENGNYQAGFNAGKAYAQAFSADIHVWELNNELDNWTGISGDGSDISQYDQAKYVLARGAIRGLLDGIHAGDPSSEGVVDNAGWCHYGFLLALWKDGVHWDITSEHWYSSYGDLQHAGCQNGINILQLLKTSFGNPIWITEFNSDTAAKANDLNAMAAWLPTAMAEWDSVAATYAIKAAHVYAFFNPDNAGNYGIMDANGNALAPYTAVQKYLAGHPSAVHAK